MNRLDSVIHPDGLLHPVLEGLEPSPISWWQTRLQPPSNL
jgi:hypothetical protein